MNKNFKHITHSILITLLINIFVNYKVNAQNIAVNGYADLSKTNFNTDKLISLTGDWEFYYGKIIKPSEFNDSATKHKNFYKVPGIWNGSKIGKIKMITDTVATYRLKVKISPKVKSLALRTERIFSSFDIYINDSLVARHGKIQTNGQKEIPGLETLYTTFIVPDTVFYITLNISNHSHRKAGIENVPQIGNITAVYKYSGHKKYLELFVIGIMIIMSFYNIGLFLLWKRNSPALYIGLLMMSVFIHLAVNNEVISVYYFKFRNVEMLYKIDFITNYTSILFTVLFFRAAHRKFYNNFMVYLLVAVMSALSLLVLISTEKIYTQTLLIFEIIVMIYAPFVLQGLIRAVIKKEPNARIQALGTIVLFITAVNDILYENRILDTGYIVSFGLTFFIMLQSYAVAKKYTLLYNFTDEMNKMMSKTDSIKADMIKHTGISNNKPLEIIAEKNNATRALIIKTDTDNNYEIKSYYSKYKHTENRNFPAEIINKAVKENKTVNISNAYEHNDTFGKEYLDKFKPKSVLCYPLIGNNNSKAVIYLENSLKINEFSSTTEQIISLISNQLLNLLDNFEKYQELEALNIHLEEIVEQRTTEVMQQREELNTQKEEIERQNKYLRSIYDDISFKNKEISDSINYAKRIQRALLPDKKVLNEAFPQNFVFYCPKETLSGDFYWTFTENKKNIKLFTVADCTGHGVPGALMSIIGNNLLYSQVTQKRLVKPANILDNIQKEIGKKLKQNILSESKDGMDLAMISYDPAKNIIEYAGARNPIILIRNNQIYEYKADRMSIGGAEHARIAAESKFSQETIEIQKGDTIYLFTDGYIDQIGGAKSRKFMKNRFYETLLLIHNDSLDVQHQKIKEIFHKWKAENIQVDDVLVAGIRF